MHRRQDRLTDLTFEVGHPAVPGPGAGVLGTPKRKYPFGSAEGAIAEVIIQQTVAVAIGVATVAAEPAVMRQPGVVKQALPLLGNGRLWRCPQADLRHDFAARQVD